jgi:hypothetical protein
LCAIVAAAQTSLFTVQNGIATVSIESALSDKLVVKRRKLPLTHTLDATVRIRVVDTYGVGVSGKAGHLRVFPLNAATNTFVSDAAQFADHYRSMSALDRLKSVFRLLVQGGRRISIVPQPSANDVIVRLGAVNDGETWRVHAGGAPPCCPVRREWT